MNQIERASRADHDVVVIGSGAGGGTVVNVLTKAGVKVLLLEAGPLLNPTHDFKEHMWPYEVAHRGAGEDGRYYFGGMEFGWFEAPNGYWHIDGEPYTVEPGDRFDWFRSRILGGRTNHFGRTMLRFADGDFKPYSTDGLGADWPLTYAELEPWYDKTESFIGVHGTREGIRGAPDGVFQPAPPFRAHELYLKKACAKLGIPVIAARKAMITQSLNGRPACHYCGQCGRGCLGGSAYSSAQTQILPALKTGNLEIIPNAMAREIVVGKDGLAQAVSFIDKTTRRERQVRCRRVVLAASACESARLLLNSKSSLFPNGLANSSGVVGRYLTDSVGVNVSGQIPALEGLTRYNSDAIRYANFYIPWWRYGKDNGFPRSYQIGSSTMGFGMPAIGMFNSNVARHQGFGKSLKDKLRKDYGSQIVLAGSGEMIPNEKSFCEIDPDVVDEFGIPVLRFHFQRGVHELAMARDMEQTIAAIFERLGADRRSLSIQGISDGGKIIHEVGTVRMGSDKNTSALNLYGQAHDVKNLFVADGGSFVSNPHKNPTLTIIALAWRLSDFMAEEMRKGNV